MTEDPSDASYPRDPAERCYCTLVGRGGVVQLPIEIMDHLGLQAGGKVFAQEVSDGSLALRPALVEGGRQGAGCKRRPRESDQ